VSWRWRCDRCKCRWVNTPWVVDVGGDWLKNVARSRREQLRQLGRRNVSRATTTDTVGSD
jgi:hypothetical protein